MAQIGIGTVTPEGALDIHSVNGGVLFPRLNIIDLTNSSPVSNPKGGNLANGTLIWNNTLDNTKTILPGIHYWNNNKWNRLSIEINNFKFSQTTNQVPYLSGNNCGELQLAANNPYTHFSNNKIVTIGLNVSNVSGVICNMNIEIKLKHILFRDVSLYLMSPNGKVLKLTTGNGNLTANTQVPPYSQNFTKVIVNFSDDASTNITSFDGNYNRANADYVFKYKPEGTLENNVLNSTDFMPANVTKFQDFNETSPNGMWRLYIKDINITNLENYNLYVEDVKLNIATYPGKLPDNFVLLNEKLINSSDSNYIVAQAEYNAHATSNVIQTVITRSVQPTTNTTITSFPSDLTILSSGTNSTYNSIRWTAVSNRNIDANIMPNTNYYYQLWRKAEVIAPIAQNENYTFVLNTEY
jgi:subtilisin-like proprotein convertase family protein